MTGGEIVVTGSVGTEAGAYARRGLIVVRGDVGENAACGLIAGTLVVFGRVGADAGAWNKRGSIVALGAAAVPATYRFACVYRPTVLRVLFGYLRRTYAIPVADRFVTGRWKRYCGDVSELGKGELLTWAEA
jgi:formylmethanofuran dehydrogenase subunit C